MTEYIVKNTCSKCGNHVEIVVTNGRTARFMERGPCLCNQCIPYSNWKVAELTNKGDSQDE